LRCQNSADDNFGNDWNWHLEGYTSLHNAIQIVYGDWRVSMHTGLKNKIKWGLVGICTAGGLIDLLLCHWRRLSPISLVGIMINGMHCIRYIYAYECWRATGYGFWIQIRL
jgi:hypothetical protein